MTCWPTKEILEKQSGLSADKERWYERKHNNVCGRMEEVEKPAPAKWNMQPDRA